MGLRGRIYAKGPGGSHSGIRIVRADTAQQYALEHPEQHAGISRQAGILYRAERIGSVTITLTADAYRIINHRYFRWYAITLLVMIPA
ncbi:hypothetical protein CSA56_07255, partial [candidate division KSB3 bacterium]